MTKSNRGKDTRIDSDDCSDHILKDKIGSLVRTRTDRIGFAPAFAKNDIIFLESGEILLLVDIETFGPFLENSCWSYDFYFIHKDWPRLRRHWDMNYYHEFNLDTLFEVIEL